jgi:hypothetical protein
MRFASFTLRAQCAHCGGPLPLVGPIRSIVCTACSKATPISADEWGRILKFAAQGVGSMNIGRHEIVVGTLPSPKPACATCGALVPLEAGADTATACACGARLGSYPAPPWLAEQLPAIAQIYGADRESDGAASGVAVTSVSAMQPVVMACPSCGGGLNLTTESQRTTRCTFCRASVYLPDDLWRVLHPVKTVRAWSIGYSGKLEK